MKFRDYVFLKFLIFYYILVHEKTGISLELPWKFLETNLDKIIKSVIYKKDSEEKFMKILTWKFLHPLWNNRLNFQVIAFMKTHGRILENSRIFKAPWRKCYMLIEGNSPGTFFSGMMLIWSYYSKLSNHILT